MGKTKWDEIFDQLKWAEDQTEQEQDEALPSKDTTTSEEELDMSEVQLVKMLKDEYITIKQAATSKSWSNAFDVIVNNILHLSGHSTVSRPTRVITYASEKTKTTTNKWLMWRDLPWPK